MLFVVFVLVVLVFMGISIYVPFVMTPKVVFVVVELPVVFVLVELTLLLVLLDVVVVGSSSTLLARLPLIRWELCAPVYRPASYTGTILRRRALYFTMRCLKATARRGHVPTPRLAWTWIGNPSATTAW